LDGRQANIIIEYFLISSWAHRNIAAKNNFTKKILTGKVKEITIGSF
jgi:hypothetical protein